MLTFTKMSGSGNDFIVIDHRQRFLGPEEIPALAQRLCPRGTAVGADGLLLLEEGEGRLRMRVINADGSEAEMCGNGARCMTRYLYENAITGPEMSFDTLAGTIHASIAGEGARIKLTDTRFPLARTDIHACGRTFSGYSIDTGVPHLVIRVEDLEKVPVNTWGRELRHHSLFHPAGTNVNFYERRGDGSLGVRTYERGVEDETLACGTGATATALVAAAAGEEKGPLTVETRSHTRLTISFTTGSGGYTQIFLEGPAITVYRGELCLSWR